ncbi:hypothetical protein [Candidatus Harpocratesius sp.]
MELTSVDPSKNNISLEMGIRAVIISNCSGIPLVTLKIDSELNENIMIPFISAIQSYCTNLIAKSQELYFKTDDIDLYVFMKKYEDVELMIYSLMDQKIKKSKIQAEAEMALDAFIKEFPPKILRNWDGNTDLFRTFEKQLQEQVSQYIAGLKSTNLKKNEGTGFFHQFWSKLFKKNQN